MVVGEVVGGGVRCKYEVFDFIYGFAWSDRFGSTDMVVGVT